MKEALLQTKEEWLAGIIDSAMDGIIVVDEQQRIIVFNAAAEKMFGYTASEMLGQPLDRLIPEQFRGAHAGHSRKFEQTHLTRRAMGVLGTIFGVRASGEEFLIEAAISQTTDSGARLFTVILRDRRQTGRATPVGMYGSKKGVACWKKQTVSKASSSPTCRMNCENR